jgi:hypothetical protein
VKLDVINSGVFGDTVDFLDDSPWLESDDIADDDLRGSLGKPDWLEDDELRLSCDVSEAVDRYLGRLHAAAWLPNMGEVR